MSLEMLLGFILASFSLAIMPGPDNMYVLTESVSSGPKRGLAITTGLVSGVVVHTTLVATGLSLVLINYGGIFLMLKYFGAAYLLKLAFDAWKEDAVSFHSHSQIKKSDDHVFSSIRKGFLMNVLNPKVTLFFLAFLPQFVITNGWSPVYQMMILGLIFMLVSFIVFGTIALVSGSAATLITSPKFFTISRWLKIIVLIILAGYLLIAEK